MRNIFAKASPSDAIILYFSGHGVPGGLVCYDGVLYYSSVLSIMRQSKAQQRTKGDHRQFKHPSKPGTVTIRGKESEVLNQFLLNSIWHQAGWK